MQIQRINITIPNKILKKLKNAIPEGQRSRFITRAVEEKLDKQVGKKLSLEESLKANYEFDKKIAEDFKSIELDNWPD